MFEYIGNKLRASLAASTMITRPGGLAEVIDTLNGNERTEIPRMQRVSRQRRCVHGQNI